MNYPLLSEYIEAIKSAEDNFEVLNYLRPVLGEDGEPVMTSGNFAVVFKMKDIESGKFYALKCFTKDQEGREEAYHQIVEELKDVESSYLISIQYLDKELFVDTSQTTETEFPVLLMDWVEGKTLDKYLRENLDDKYALEMLAYRFSQLAQWLIPQPFAHGDLKPDNILVREDGTLVLVDYDGMYVPAMKGQKARELGSPDFRHPLRTENDFDEQIDDFPLTSILLSLKAISYNPLWLIEFGAEDRLLFSNSDYRNIGICNCLKAVLSVACIELKKLSSLMILACCDCIIKPNNIHLLKINIPIPIIPIIKGTYNDKPYKFSLYDVYEGKRRSELTFDYASFIDPSLSFSNSCIVSKELPPVEEMYYSIRPNWPWDGSLLENSAIIASKEDLYSPTFYKCIERLEKNKNLFIAINDKDKCGLIDHMNNIIIEFCYTNLEAIENERLCFRATNPDGLFGIIDEKNKPIIDFKYVIREGLKGGYFLCKKNNANMLLSLDGEEIAIDFEGTIIHFGDIAIGIASPVEFWKQLDGRIKVNEYKCHVFRRGKLSSIFSVSFNSSWRNLFKMTDKDRILVEHFSTNSKDYVYIPDSYIDLDGNCREAPAYVSHRNKSIYKSNKKEQKELEQKNIWLSNYVREHYLIGVHLPYNDANMPTEYDIKIYGNIALVSYSWYSLVYPDDGGHGYLGYADENMCYW